MSAPLHPGAAALADALATAGLLTGSAVIHLGMRSMASIVWGEVQARRPDCHRVLAAQLDAWGAGDDDALAESHAAWEARGCEDCALRALRAEGRCMDCEAEAAEAAL